MNPQPVTLLAVRSRGTLPDGIAFPVAGWRGNVPCLVVYAHPNVCRQLVAAARLDTVRQPGWVRAILGGEHIARRPAACN